LNIAVGLLIIGMKCAKEKCSLSGEL